MTRQRPKPRTNPAAARPSKLRPCTYQPDPAMPDPADPDHPLCGQPDCALPYRNARHTPPAGAHDGQVEHRRRTGDREEDT